MGPGLGFVAYHWLSTIGIMGYHSRFFQPAVIPVVLAAALAWPRFASGRAWLRVLPFLVSWPALVHLAFRSDLLERQRHGYYLSWLPNDLWTVAVVGTCLLVATTLHRRWPGASLAIPPLVVLATLWVLPPRLPHAWDDPGAAKRIYARMVRAMRGIDLVEACLDEPIHLYHSELGLPGVMFPESRITDLSGLMNPALAFSQIGFDALCLADPPDVLFLPHETHARMNREILAGRCIERFERVPLQGRITSQLYLRKDRMAAFEACRRADVRARRTPEAIGHRWPPLSSNG